MNFYTQRSPEWMQELNIKVRQERTTLSGDVHFNALLP